MSNGPFADFQNEVYLKGLFGEQPTLPFGWRETEAAAHAAMTPGAVGYVAGGAGGEDTMRANRQAFDRWRLVPRVLRGIPAQRLLPQESRVAALIANAKRLSAGAAEQLAAAAETTKRAVERQFNN